jgi:aliphatic nitrilase
VNDLPKFKVAAVHASPEFLDKRATTEKAVSLIAEAASHGAELIVFPEAFIPGFPVWTALWAPIYNHDLFVLMVDNSVLVPGPELALIAAEAKHRGVFVSIGFSEKSPISAGCLWNSNLLIDDAGQVLNHHRKLMPTFYEKLIWAQGDGAGLRVADTRLGRIGALICGENTNPLARYSLMAQGEQVHISSYPMLWPTKPPSTGGNYDNVSANRIRAMGHSFEAKVFGIVCAGYMDKKMRDFLVDRDPAVAAIVDGSLRGASLFVDPSGTQIGQTIQNDEGIIYADFDLNSCIEPKQFHDLVGYYNRFDVFDLRISRKRTVAATFIDSEEIQTMPQLLDDTHLGE